MSFAVVANDSTGFGIALELPLLETISDNFDDNSLNTTLWAEWNAGDVVETSQSLRITSETSSGSFKGIETNIRGNLTGSYVMVEVVHVLTGLNGYSTNLQVIKDEFNTATIQVYGTALVAQTQVAGSFQTVGTATYDSIVHRWWRIREASGTVYFEYSAEGTIWQELASIATPFSVASLVVALFIGSDAANAGTDTAIFDNLNTAPVLSSDVVVSRGQYRNDQYTSIAVGGSTINDGVSNNVWLDMDVSSATPTANTTPRIEVEATGAGFNNVASVSGTARTLKVANLPTTRRGGSLVYDAKNKRFILFGGNDGTVRYNEVWELTADSAYHRWNKLTPSGTPPTAKNLAASTYVRGTTSGAADKAYMIIWGGSSPSDLNEMHALDVSTPGSEAWSTITQTSAPSARSYLTHHMASKSTASNTTDMYLFGGWPGATRTNDLYRCTFNVNTPTAVTWTTLKANGAVGSPSARSGTGIVYDSANDRLVLVGGYNGTTYLADAWSYSISGNTFTQLSPTGTAPGGRELGSIGYDATNQRAIIIGGWQGSISTSRNDVIQLSLTAGSEAWTTIKSNDATNQGMLTFSNATAAVDTARNIMVVTTLYGYDTTAATKYTYAFNLNDTSATASVYSLNTVDFFRARDAPGVAYNSTRGEAVLLNGYGTMDDDATIEHGDHIAEVWAYDRTNNKWRYAAGGPFVMPQAEGGLTIYDSINDRIIYFGGLTGYSRRSNDVWQIKADAHGLYHPTKLEPTGTKPAPRWLMAGCYDAAHNRMVFWGGQDNADAYSDTWALDLTEGSEAWSQLTPTGTPPTKAWQSAYAYDSANNRLYVHAGATNQGGSTFTSQLFYLDLSTTNGAWTNTGVTGGLAVRGANMGYDSLNQRLVCFGGYDGSVVNNTLRYTSTSSFTSWTTQAAPDAPTARRSAGSMVVGNYFLVVAGRPVSGTWFSDTQELNFTDAPGSWSWANKNPAIYQLMSLAATGLTLDTSYHWQSWATNSTGNNSAVSSFGANSESAADFIVSSGVAVGGLIKVWNGSAFVSKPVKVWDGSAWVTKPLKWWNGTEWVLTPGASTDISLKATSSNTATSVNSLDVTIPATVAVGDLLVLVVAQTTNATTLFNAISGWTKQGEQRAGAAAYTIAVYTRVAQSGDAGATVTSTSANVEHYAGQLRVYSGVDQTTPLDATVAFAQVDPAATSGAAPAVTVATAGAMLVAVYGIPTTTNTTVSASDWTDPTDFANELATCTSSANNNAALATYDKLASGTGSQGPFTATVTQSRRWSLATIALKPAA